MKWRIYYAGGARYSDADGLPWDAPATGVQCVVKEDSTCGRVVLSCQDYYWWDGKRGEWFAGDVSGYFQYMMFAKGPKAVLFGQYVTNEEFHTTMIAALADPDFPIKSARHSSECVNHTGVL